MTFRNNEKPDSLVLILCLGISIVIFALDLLIPLGVAAGVPYILVILVSLRSSIKLFTVYMAVWASILTAAGFYFSPAGGELWKVLFNRGIALFAIWTTAYGRERLLSD